jgi:hypothetical protein
MIATFGVGSAGVPALNELSLMPVTLQWIPVGDVFEKQLLDKLVGESRAFVKGLRYNTPRSETIASAMLLDAGSEPWTLSISSQHVLVGSPDLVDKATSTGKSKLWVWRPLSEPMPRLPDRYLAAKHIAPQSSGTASADAHRPATC